MSFLSLYFSQKDSRLTVFLTKGKRVFRVLILSLVRSRNGYESGRLSYGQASNYRTRHRYYVTVLVFVCLYVRTYDISTPLQNSTVWPDCYRMDWCDCNRMDWREHSIGPFVHNILIGIK